MIFFIFTAMSLALVNSNKMVHIYVGVRLRGGDFP